MAEHRVGVMQGRLSPRPEHRLQAFPHQSWPEEFAQAKHLGFSYLEWIYEAERAAENPIASGAGRAAIRACAAQSGLPVGSVCGDYFMIHRLSGGTEQSRRENAAALRELVRWTRELGATRILLPLLETSAVDTPELKRQVSESIRLVCPALEAYDVVLGLEMEIPGREYAQLIHGIGHAQVRAYYDTGNSTAQGLNIESDIEPLLPVLEAVHLKDRVSFGTSRPFGQGNANFAGFFAVLARAGYAGDFLTQHYFDADPQAAAAHSLAFVRGQLRARKAA
ncbi:MAG: sugar phosphate isomerase/epimerase family protein [Polyangiaceae bacterium]